MLHRVSKECPEDMLQDVVNDLLEIENEPPWGNCVGMAAPQIGYPFNVFVVLGEPFVNVKSVKGVGDKTYMTEGCFSVPHEWHSVERYAKVKVNINGETKEYDGFKAEVIQHEFDHCKGKLIND